MQRGGSRPRQTAPPHTRRPTCAEKARFRVSFPATASKSSSSVRLTSSASAPAPAAPAGPAASALLPTGRTSTTRAPSLPLSPAPCDPRADPRRPAPAAP